MKSVSEVGSSQFEAVAQSLGHSVDELRAGRPQESLIIVRSIEHARSILCRASDEERQERGKSFFKHIESRLSRLEGFHDRADAYIYADYQLTEQDRIFIDKFLPVEVHATSIPDKTLAPGEVWVLGINAQAVAINVNTLTMGPGSKIVAMSTRVTLTVGTLIRQASSTHSTARSDLKGHPHFGYMADNYDIGVLGLNPDQWVRTQLPTATWRSFLNGPNQTVNDALAKAFASAGLALAASTPIDVVTANTAWRIADYTYGRTYSLMIDVQNPTQIDVFQVAMQGTLGGDGKQPGQAPGGTCKCSNTEPGDNGQPGYTGGGAGNGATGTTGDNGLPNLRADINITDLQGVLVVAVKGGDGAQGGKGGPGGAGAKGGQGGYGTQCSGTCDDGGSGGTGGVGGVGGTGGKGGNGANANDIYVALPQAQAGHISFLKQTSLPGLAGPAGDGGSGGAGGDSGGAAMYCSGGGQGNRGADGNNGTVGTVGDRGGLAPQNIFVNGKPVTTV